MCRKHGLNRGFNDYRFGPQMKRKDKDIQTVLMAVKYQALPNCISRGAIGPRPKSLGHGLEIIL
jgi:hypothetical protein